MPGVDLLGMRDWIGRMTVAGTVVLIVGGLYAYASLQKVIRSEKKVYYPAITPRPLPPPPTDATVTEVADIAE